jgi:hypothetical protein
VNRRRHRTQHPQWQQAATSPEPARHAEAGDAHVYLGRHSRYLQKIYAYKVNTALEQGREDLTAEPADEVRNALEAGSHPQR